MMEPVIAAAITLGVVAIVASVAWKICAINKTPKEEKIGEYPSSFHARRAAVRAEVQARKSEDQLYRERLAAAFEEAKAANALIISETEWHEIESDQYRNRNDPRKTLLTRFTPVITRELAEMIREQEIEYEHMSDTECVATICLLARQLKWQVVEVPKRYEPPNVRPEDRIVYPDLSTQWHRVPESLSIAARQFLDYGPEYIAAQVAIREAEDESEPG